MGYLQSPRGAAAALALVGVVVVAAAVVDGVDIGAVEGGGRSVETAVVVVVAEAVTAVDSVGSDSVGSGRVAEGCSCLMQPTGFDDEIMPVCKKGCFIINTNIFFGI